jgi:hypothetical protein
MLVLTWFVRITLVSEGNQSDSIMFSFWRVHGFYLTHGLDVFSTQQMTSTLVIWRQSPCKNEGHFWHEKVLFSGVQQWPSCIEGLMHYQQRCKDMRTLMLNSVWALSGLVLAAHNDALAFEAVLPHWRIEVPHTTLVLLRGHMKGRWLTMVVHREFLV